VPPDRYDLRVVPNERMVAIRDFSKSIRSGARSGRLALVSLERCKGSGFSLSRIAGMSAIVRGGATKTGCAGTALCGAHGVSARKPGNIAIAAAIFVPSSRGRTRLARAHRQAAAHRRQHHIRQRHRVLSQGLAVGLRYRQSEADAVDQRRSHPVRGCGDRLSRD
jgi:hypothetical protein